MARRHTVKFTANFERNLQEVESFLLEAEASQAFDALLDELSDTVIPNLERFPGMGRLFFERPILSIEASNGLNRLRSQLRSIRKDGDIGEYVMSNYLLLYAFIDDKVYLLSIRHHRQLSFDFEALWVDPR